MRVTYYTSPTCVPCKTMKPLAQKACDAAGVQFTVVDIENPKGRRVPPTILSVPTIVVTYPDGAELFLSGQQATVPTLKKALR